MSTNNNIPTIIVFGETGAGKSSFINAALGEGLEVGHGLESCTQEIQIGVGEVNGVLCNIVDTQGFDDTTSSEDIIFRKTCAWLAGERMHGMKFCGIIYLRDISQNRMTGVAVQTMRIFRKMLGNKAWDHVTLCTTHWDVVPADRAQARERDLRTKFWNDMVAQGSLMERYDNTPSTAQKIVTRMLDNASISLRIQDEMVNEGKSYAETEVATEIRGEMDKTIAKAEKEIQSLKEQLEAALARERRAIKEAYNERQEAIARRALEEAYNERQEEIARQKKKREDMNKKPRELMGVWLGKFKVALSSNPRESAQED